MNTRLTTIRLVLAFAVSLVLCWVDPWWAWVPVALFMPPLFPVIKLYWSSVKRRSLTSATDWTGTDSSYLASGVGLCFDRLNEVVYRAATISGNQKIIKSDEDEFTTYIEVFDNSAAIGSIECDPTNEELFYQVFGAGAGSAAHVRTVNYDGTGDTLLKAWTHPTGVAQISDLLYNLDLDRLYYIQRSTGPPPLNLKIVELRYMSPDGTGDTLVRQISQAAEFKIHSIAFDIANSYLFWSEFPSPGFTPEGQVKRSAPDGTSLTDIYTIADFPNTGAVTLDFSQRDELLYVWDVGGDTIQVMENDGSNSASVATISTAFGTTGFDSQPIPSRFALGDGLETVGAGAIL